MNLDELMTRKVETCGPDDMLSCAAQIMWDRDCGCVPVVDSERRLVGVITDRDICMAAYTKGRPIQQIAVQDVMSRDLKTCKPSDSVEVAQMMMQSHQLRRLPVVGSTGTLVGVISLSDLTRAAERERNPKMKEVQQRQVEATLAAVSRPRIPAPATTTTRA
jgi:CBS domain-containing protein